MQGREVIPLVEERRFPWLEVLDALYRRRRIVLVTVLVGFLLATVTAWLQPHLYEASTKIQLTEQALAGPRVKAMTERQIQTELDLLTSPGLLRILFESESAIAETAEAEIGLRNRLRSILTAPKRLLRRLSPEAARDRFVRQHAERIDIKQVNNTNVVKVAFTDHDPEKAARFVNGLIDKHIERIASLGGGSEARSFYEQQANILLERWREANSELLAFRRENGGSVSEDEIQRTISGFQSQSVATETQILELEATIAFLTAQLAQVPQTIEAELLEKQDGSAGLLTSRLLELQINRIELLSTYTPESKVVRDLDRQIADLQRLMVSNEGQIISEKMTQPNPHYQALEQQLLQAEAKLNAAKARLNALSIQIDNYVHRLSRMEGATTELTRLQSDVDNAKEDHRLYLKRTEMARLESALDASGSVNVTILERAEVPLSPLPSKGLSMMVLGTVLALIAGIALALGVDFLNPTVKSGPQLERLTGLPVIAELSLEGD